jgi:hypothetical protein
MSKDGNIDPGDKAKEPANETPWKYTGSDENKETIAGKERVRKKTETQANGTELPEEYPRGISRKRNN